MSHVTEARLPITGFHATELTESDAQYLRF